jgi:hypothetical protein
MLGTYQTLHREEAHARHVPFLLLSQLSTKTGWRIEYEPVLSDDVSRNFIFREDFDIIKAYRDIGDI